MAQNIEFLMHLHKAGRPMGEALFAAAGEAGFKATWSRHSHYVGASKILMIYGIGDPKLSYIRSRHLAAGGVVAVWDVGYFHRSAQNKEYLRVSINHDHPHRLFELAPDDGGERFSYFGLSLQETYSPDGHIVLVGLGPKSRVQAGPAGADWEIKKLKELRTRFPGREIVHRPKPRRPFPTLPDCRVVLDESIDVAICGASLVVSRHSNASVDATRLGVPFECEDGAARWLSARPFTKENRLLFLRMLSWWQWKPTEAAASLEFVVRAIDEARKAA